MRFGGTSFPRRKVLVGGLAIRCAQSRGEWPGSRRNFFEGREEGARVDVEGARVDMGGAREREGGVRRVAAVEGGGRRVVEGFGGVLKVGGVGVGRKGGGIRAGGDGSGFRLALSLGRGGGSIADISGCGAESLRVSRLISNVAIGLTAVGTLCVTPGASHFLSPASGATTDMDGPQGLSPSSPVYAGSLSIRPDPGFSVECFSAHVADILYL